MTHPASRIQPLPVPGTDTGNYAPLCSGLWWACPGGWGGTGQSLVQPRELGLGGDSHLEKYLLFLFPHQKKNAHFTVRQTHPAHTPCKAFACAIPPAWNTSADLHKTDHLLTVDILAQTSSPQRGRPWLFLRLSLPRPHFLPFMALSCVRNVWESYALILKPWFSILAAQKFPRELSKILMLDSTPD